MARSGSHVVVGIAGKLEDMGRRWGLVLSHVPRGCSVVLKDGVGIGGDICVRVDGHEGRGVDVSVDVVGHEPLAETGDNDIIRDGQ